MDVIDYAMCDDSNYAKTNEHGLLRLQGFEIQHGRHQPRNTPV
jgi:hypothetical protein